MVIPLIMGIVLAIILSTRMGRKCGTFAKILPIMVYHWLLASWNIYGLRLYYSDENDCTEKSDTKVAAVFMLIFIILGLLQIALTICMTVVNIIRFLNPNSY